MSWMSGIIDALGLGIQAYNAYNQSQNSQSPEDMEAQWRRMQYDANSPTMSRRVTYTEDGRPFIDNQFTPAVQGVFDQLVGRATGDPQVYRRSAALDPLQHELMAYQLERQGMPRMYGPLGDLYGGTESANSFTPGSGDVPDEPNYNLGAGSTPEDRAGGVYSPDGSRDMPGYPTGNGGIGGGGIQGGGANVGYGGLGGLAGGGGDFNLGDAFGNMPDWMHRFLNSRAGQSIIGQIVPGGGVVTGGIMSYLNNNYPTGMMHPDSPKYAEPNSGYVNPDTGEAFLQEPYQMPDWTGAYNNPYEPNYSNTGRDRNRNAPGSTPGDGSGGLNAYNRTIWQNPKDGSPINSGFWEPPEIIDPNPWERQR